MRPTTKKRHQAVQAAVIARKDNLTTFASDQAAFVAQLNTAGGKKTFLSYLWKAELPRVLPTKTEFWYMYEGFARAGDAYDDAQNS